MARSTASLRKNLRMDAVTLDGSRSFFNFGIRLLRIIRSLQRIRVAPTALKEGRDFVLLLKKKSLISFPKKNRPSYGRVSYVYSTLPPTIWGPEGNVTT